MNQSKLLTEPENLHGILNPLIRREPLHIRRGPVSFEDFPYFPISRVFQVKKVTLYMLNAKQRSTSIRQLIYCEAES